MWLVGAWADPRPADAAPERLRTAGNPGSILKKILRDAAPPHTPAPPAPHALFAFLRADSAVASAKIDRLDAAAAAAARLDAAAKIPPRRPDLATPDLLAEMHADLRALVAETPFWTVSGTAAPIPSKALGAKEDRFGDWARRPRPPWPGRGPARPEHGLNDARGGGGLGAGPRRAGTRRALVQGARAVPPPRLERRQQASWGDARREEALRAALGRTRRPERDEDRRRNAEVLAPLDPWPKGLPDLARHWPEAPREAHAR